MHVALNILERENDMKHEFISKLYEIDVQFLHIDIKLTGPDFSL